MTWHVDTTLRSWLQRGETGISLWPMPSGAGMYARLTLFRAGPVSVSNAEAEALAAILAEARIEAAALPIHGEIRQLEERRDELRRQMIQYERQKAEAGFAGRQQAVKQIVALVEPAAKLERDLLAARARVREAATAAICAVAERHRQAFEARRLELGARVEEALAPLLDALKTEVFDRVGAFDPKRVLVAAESAGLLASS